MNRHVILTAILMLLATVSHSTSLVAQEKKDKTEAVTAKEIETFGKNLIDKRCQIDCKFVKVSDSWVNLLLKDDKFVGIYLEDSKGVYFQFAFANKEKYGRDFLKMDMGEKLRLIGTVKEVRSEIRLHSRGNQKIVRPSRHHLPPRRSGGSTARP